MEKKLFQSEQEFVASMIEEIDCIGTAEEILGIEVAYSNGVYASDLNGDSKYSDEEVEEIERLYPDPSQYRVVDAELLPQSYPVLALFSFEKTFDRTGGVEIQVLEYVYQSDFS
jgi:hypothetical protein